MSTNASGWTQVAPNLPLYTYDYSFGPGRSNSLAIVGPSGIVVVSPPSHPSEDVFKGLDVHGKVCALVASNAFHHLGIPPWKARYPDARVFAPAQAIPRVTKKTGLAGVTPLSEAEGIAGADVELIDMPHYKTGEVLVRVSSGSDVVWYTTDVVMNLPELPPSFLFRMAFKWTGSGPGLRPNGIAALFMMKDKRAVHAWLREEIGNKPPTLLVPAHGPVVPMATPGRELLDALS